MTDRARTDILGIAFGPSNLAVAIAIDAVNRRGQAPLTARFLERQPRFAWHPDMLLPGSDMQISFVKDLVTLRDPTSPFSFINYLHEKGRLTAFLNLKTFNPSRVEFNDYLAWAADRLRERVSYGETVTAVEPVLRHDRIVDFTVSAMRSDGSTRRRSARHLVVAPGGTPHVPAVFRGATGLRLIHSSRYLGGIDAALEGKTADTRIAVIGAGQSAAEIAVDAGQRFPRAKIDLVFRSHALRPADDSAFANTIFDPAEVDLVFGLPHGRRADMLKALKHTNYAVVDGDLIARLYAVIYDETVHGDVRHAVLNDTDVRAAEEWSDRIKLAWCHRLTGRIESRIYDAIVLATGYERIGLPDMIEPLRPYLTGDGIDRDYSLPLRASGASVHVQGWSESSHGLSDTLLSLIAIRAGEIVTSIEAQSEPTGSQSLTACR